MAQRVLFIIFAVGVLVLLPGCSLKGGAAEVEALPVAREVCGSDVALRRGDHHLRSSTYFGANELRAEIDRRSNAVAVDLSGLDWPSGDASVVIECSTVALPPGDGELVAVSLAGTSARSLVVGGYGSGSGRGIFVEFRFGFVGEEGSSDGWRVTVGQRLLYSGCEFTYPDCLMHREGDEIAYFFDVDRQAICGLFLSSGEVAELANAVQQPELRGTRYLIIGTARSSPEGRGVMLSASPRPHYRSLMVSTEQNPIFNLADTDGDQRLDRFWPHPLRSD